MKWSATIVVVSMCAALGVSEGVLSARGLYRLPDTPITTSRPGLYTADPHVGHTLWPSKTTTYRYLQASEVAISLVSNADEFRASRGDWTARHGVPYADLTDAIHGAGTDTVYIQDNWHGNPMGHRIAARELQGLIRERLGRS